MDAKPPMDAAETVRVYAGVAERAGDGLKVIGEAPGSYAMLRLNSRK